MTDRIRSNILVAALLISSGMMPSFANDVSDTSTGATREQRIVTNEKASPNVQDRLSESQSSTQQIAVSKALFEQTRWAKYQAAGELAYQRCLYPESESAFAAAVKEAEHYGLQDARLLLSVKNLASVYQVEGECKAEASLNRYHYLEHALPGVTARTDPMSDSEDSAEILDGLAAQCKERDRYLEAESLYKLALVIREHCFGPTHCYVALSLDNLAALYTNQAHYEETEPTAWSTPLGAAFVLVRLPLIKEFVAKAGWRPTSNDLANVVNDLTHAYGPAERYAKPVQERSRAIAQHMSGNLQLLGWSCMQVLALYQAQDKYVRAEAMLKRSLAIKERVLGIGHPMVALAMHNLADIYNSEYRFAEAEQLYCSSSTILEKVLEPLKGDIASRERMLAAEDRTHAAAANLAQKANDLFELQKYVYSEPLFKRSLAMLSEKKAQEASNIDVAAVLENYAAILRRTNRLAAANGLERRAEQIKQSQPTLVMPI